MSTRQITSVWFLSPVGLLAASNEEEFNVAPHFVQSFDDFLIHGKLLSFFGHQNDIF